MSDVELPKQSSRRAWRRGPFVHFLLLGGLLFLAVRFASLGPAEPDVVIRAQDVEALEQDWIRRTGRAPNEAELSGMVERRIDEELMLVQAFELGWNRSDGVVVRRLIQNQRFLDPESEQDDAALLERAYAQGMDRSDIVVRRRLLERIRLTIGEFARRDEPDDALLREYMEAQSERFMRPEAIRVTQIFLSRDRRGAALEEDAERLGHQLESEPPSPDDALSFSDPLLIAHHLPLWSEEQLARRLGFEFADSAFDAPEATWTGPVKSSYGLHFVWVHERVPERLPELDPVRAEVRGALLHEREGEALERHLEALRRDAVVVVEERPPTGG
jgi:hypothetical protein